MGATKTSRTWYSDRALAPEHMKASGKYFPKKFDNRRFEKFTRSLVERATDSLRPDFDAIKSDFRVHGQNRDTLPRLFALVGRRLQDNHGTSPSVDECRLATAMLQGNGIESASLNIRRTSLILAVTAASLSDEPVHLLSPSVRHVNWLYHATQPILNGFGISTACVTRDQNIPVRKRQYRANVVVTTPRELALDYLRDQVCWPDRQGGLQVRLDRLYGPVSKSASLVMPGLYWAFLDRIDQILIDEARIPVIVGSGDDEYPDMHTLRELYEFVGTLNPGVDFEIESLTEEPVVNRAAFERTARVFPMLVEPGTAAEGASRLVVNALRVRHLLKPDDHYQRHGERIVIPGLIPGQGYMTPKDFAQVRRFIECREQGAQLITEDVVARITYLKLFGRYHELAGAATTIQGIENELQALYNLAVYGKEKVVAKPRVKTRYQLFINHSKLFEFLHETATLPDRDGHCMMIVTGSQTELDLLLDRFHQAGLTDASELFTAGGDSKYSVNHIRLATLREFLPVCADESMWKSYSRVDVFALCMPPARRHVRECSLPAASGRAAGVYWQLMVNEGHHKTDTALAPSTLRRIGNLAAAPVFKPLLNSFFTFALRDREQAEAALRSAAVAHQASIDELFTFSGRGGT